MGSSRLARCRSEAESPQLQLEAPLSLRNPELPHRREPPSKGSRREWLPPRRGLPFPGFSFVSRTKPSYKGRTVRVASRLRSSSPQNPLPPASERWRPRQRLTMAGYRVQSLTPLGSARHVSV